MQQVPAPLLSCEAVLTEAAYFLGEDGLGVDALFALLERGVLRIDFDLCVHWPRLRTLMARYDRMDLADACIVAMTEQHRKVRVLTVDRRDFSRYRRNDRRWLSHRRRCTNRLRTRRRGAFGDPLRLHTRRP